MSIFTISFSWSSTLRTRFSQNLYGNFGCFIPSGVCRSGGVDSIQTISWFLRSFFRLAFTDMETLQTLTAEDILQIVLLILFQGIDSDIYIPHNRWRTLSSCTLGQLKYPCRSLAADKVHRQILTQIPLYQIVDIDHTVNNMITFYSE